MTIAGNSVDVPSTYHTVVLKGSNMDVTQVSDEIRVEYSGSCSIDMDEDEITFSCTLSSTDQTSSPSCDLVFNRANGELTLSWEQGMGPAFDLSNPDFSGITPPQAQEVWVLMDSEGKVMSELCTEWAVVDTSGFFFPRNRLDELPIFYELGKPKVGIAEDINTLLKKVDNHLGWKESTAGGIRESHRDLEFLMDQVETAILEVERYSEIGMNLPVPIPSNKLELQRNSLNRHSKRFESIREDIRTKEREEYEAEQERLEIESRCYEWTHQA